MRLIEIDEGRAVAELRRATIQDGEERRRRWWLVVLPLGLFVFWTVAGAALIAVSAATTDPEMGMLVYRAGPALWSTGLLVSLVFWLMSVTERDML